MTVSSTTTKNSYSGNASTTTFAYGFKIFADADLTVILRASTGVETVQTLTTHYTVTNAGVDTGGNVEFGSAPASGVTVVIRRNMAITQATDYVANDPFPAATHEDALDRLTFISQQMQEESDRSIKLSRTNTMTSTEFTTSAADRASKILAFDTSGELAVTQELGTYKGTSATTTTAAFVERDIVKGSTTAQLNNIYICVGASAIGDVLTDTDHFALIVDAVSAAASATTATTKASEAATSATAAATSYDNFDDRYLGAKSSNPSTDNDGASLITGALYFKTDGSGMKAYNGSAWEDVSPTDAEQTNINTVAGLSTEVAALAASAVITDMGLLATTDVIADMALLATTDIIADMNTLATSAIVADLNILATTDIVADMALLATTDIVADLNTLATSAIVTDLNILATTDIVADMNLLATSAVIADMASLAGDGASPNITALSTSGDVVVGDDLSLTSDAAVLNFGANSEVNLTHVHDTGLLLNGAMKLQFSDASQFIHAPSATVLDIAATDEIELTATLIDVVGNQTISGTLGVTGVLTGTSLDISGDVDVDGTLEADAITIGGTAVGSIFSPIAGGTGILTTGALDAGSITSNFGTINNGASAITTTGVGSFGSLDISGDIDVDGTTNLDNTDIDGTLNVQGETTLQTHLNMGDGDIIKLGASADLQIQHTGSDSRIVDSGTGSLFIGASTLGILNPALNEYMINATSDGSVDLYHNNAVKLVTASTGVNVTGGIGLGGTGAANILDDYEEGTWTPGLGSYEGSPTVAAANYTKIGRQVIAFFSITLDGTSDGSGFQITGLPFTSGNFASTSVMGGFLNWSTTDLTTPIRILVLNADTKCQVYGPTGSAVTYQNVGNDKSFRFTIIYCTA